jgi:hypothetical protein
MLLPIPLLLSLLLGFVSLALFVATLYLLYRAGRRCSLGTVADSVRIGCGLAL